MFVFVQFSIGTKLGTWTVYLNDDFGDD